MKVELLQTGVQTNFGGRSRMMADYGPSKRTRQRPNSGVWSYRTSQPSELRNKCVWFLFISSSSPSLSPGVVVVLVVVVAVGVAVGVVMEEVVVLEEVVTVLVVLAVVVAVRVVRVRGQLRRYSAGSVNLGL